MNHFPNSLYQSDSWIRVSPKMKTLRIFYAADHTPNAYMPSCRLWYNNLYLPLVDLGHDVVPLQYNLTPHFRNLNGTVPEQRAFIEKNRPRLEQALLGQIQKAHGEKAIDMFFSYFYSACVRSETIRAIRDLGIMTVNWYCNASYQFNLVEEIAPAYNFCLVPEKCRLDDYRRVGANPIYCQEAANPTIYKPYPLSQKYDVSFVGQRYGERGAYIRYLLDKGIDVRVWGLGWEAPGESAKLQLGRNWRKLKRLAESDRWKTLLGRLKGGAATASLAMPWSEAADGNIQIPAEKCGPPLSDEELVKMYSRSRVSLGFSTVGNTHMNSSPIKQIRLRDFEAPMSGAFYMVEYMEELEEFFEPDKEVVCYYDKEDLAGKVRYYLSHDKEREAIRRAGHRRAVAEHTWHKRFAAAFCQMGLCG
jgi:spore maturation protein CgeB